MTPGPGGIASSPIKWVCMKPGISPFSLSTVPKRWPVRIPMDLRRLRTQLRDDAQVHKRSVFGSRTGWGNWFGFQQEKRCRQTELSPVMTSRTPVFAQCSEPWASLLTAADFLLIQNLAAINTSGMLIYRLSPRSFPRHSIVRFAQSYPKSRTAILQIPASRPYRGEPPSLPPHRLASDTSI